MIVTVDFILITSFKWTLRTWGKCLSINAPLTCAQQHFAFAQVLDGFGHFAQTLVRQVWGVGEDDVEALRSHAGGERQRLAVVVEDELVAVSGEAAVVLEHDGRHPVRAVHHSLLQLLVHAGRAHTRYPDSKNTCIHTWTLRCLSSYKNKSVWHSSSTFTTIPTSIQWLPETEHRVCCWIRSCACFWLWLHLSVQNGGVVLPASLSSFTYDLLGQLSCCFVTVPELAHPLVDTHTFSISLHVIFCCLCPLNKYKESLWFHSVSFYWNKPGN